MSIIFTLAFSLTRILKRPSGGVEVYTSGSRMYWVSALGVRAEFITVPEGEE